MEISNPKQMQQAVPLSGMYENWFLDYASYVILERAVPSINDGLKPVQRRILHAMKELDDGRFNKVANIIGSTMQFHPHGDASIGDAIVHLGQKDLLIETQGNWGDVRTGDPAAAPRYIEARLSKFALEVIFNPQTTSWQLSYDGRKKEPITFPVKFPLLLAQGVEGIAVGLSTKILPHNFCEIIKGCIAVLKGKKVDLYPDFNTGGKMDVSDYNDGKRGGKVRVRATIEERNKSTLVIKDIPSQTTTTTSLIDSIVKANEKGKIRIKQVVDNTAAEVEILVSLPSGTSPNITIDALYAFTECEVTLSSNVCVIVDEKPRFLGVSEILKQSVDQTLELLRMELEIERAELKERIFFNDLLRIFINEGMYKHPDYENAGDIEKCYETLNQLFSPFHALFYRELTQEDFKKLIDKPLSSITRFDTGKVEKQIKELQSKIYKVEDNLVNLVQYAEKYYLRLLEMFGKGRERKTTISTFDTINVNVVAANNTKLYINRKDGFVGHGLKKEEFICDCSDIDDILTITKSGKCVVSKIQDKVFVGKDILYAGVYKKNDERMVYNMVYLDAISGKTYVKRFQVLSYTRDKVYSLLKNDKGRVLYLTANSNAEAEVITVTLSHASKARIKVFDFDFADLEIKGRQAGGNILTKYTIRKIVLKSEGKSTLGGVNVWFEPEVGRLNREERGVLLGKFITGDKIVVFYQDGTYEVTDFELTNHYDYNTVMGIYKLEEEASFNAIHYDAHTKTYYAKRFIIETNTVDKKFSFVTDSNRSKLIFISTGDDSHVEIIHKESNAKKRYSIDLTNFIEVKGWKAIGNKLPVQNIVAVSVVKKSEPSLEEIQKLKEQVRKEVENEKNLK